MQDATATGLRDPNAMVLSTCDDTGQPDSRVVLCKEVLEDGLLFYTNYNSDKGRQIAKNNKVAVNFFWDPLHRQIRMQGTVEKTSAEISDKYWNSRERGSQLSAWVSHQSEELDARGTMAELIAKAEKQFAGQPVPRPHHWGGYKFTPNVVELWVGQRSRFHDRYVFTKVQSGWSLKRLYP